MNTIELAKEYSIVNLDSQPSKVLEFAERVREEYRKELLAGSGEPVAMRQISTGIFRTDTKAFSLAGYEGVYTTDQLAAAVLRERDACANVCDEVHHRWRWDDEPDSTSGPRECAEAIRARSKA
jgi:hypothetical protein